MLRAPVTVVVRRGAAHEFQGRHNHRDNRQFLSRRARSPRRAGRRRAQAAAADHGQVFRHRVERRE